MFVVRTGCAVICFMVFLPHTTVGQSIDELITQAANSSHQFDFMMNERSNSVTVEMDMVYTIDEWIAIMESNASEVTNHLTKRKAARPGVGGYRWTNNLVPYEIAGGFNSAHQAQIQAALRDWMNYTCLTFRRARRSDRNRIRFQNGGGCSSRVGMTGGVQPISLAWGCRVKSIIIHEIGHAMGFHHEQTRPDRDNYVTIVRQNIPSQMYYNFQKYSRNVIDTYSIPYDYTSIMHYGQKAFSANGRVTIVAKDSRFQNRMGKSTGFSFRDIKLANKMYSCSSSCSKSDSDCAGQGFVGKDCNCWCPGDPYRTCSSTGGGGTGTGGGGTGTGGGGTGTGGGGTGTGGGGTGTGGGGTGTGGGGTGTRTCKDQNSRCGYWAGIGECNNNPSYMLSYCKKSCKKCTGGGGSRPCKDQSPHCGYWARRNYCNSGAYASYMRTNCRRSCNKCSTSATSTASGSGSSATCTDSNQNCVNWARTGECQSNPAYMLMSCKLSCNACDTNTPVNNSGSRVCVDGNSMCATWSRRGECRSNPNYMLLNCRRSCAVCSK